MNQPSPPISLREINADTVRSIIKLEVADDQKHFVANNAVSLAQALFSPEAWYRAIYRGDEPVGFVMLHDEGKSTKPPEHPEIGVWRFMIAKQFQGQGLGKAALLQVIEHVRAQGVYPKLLLSYVPGPGCPEPFYRGLGFVPNGRMDAGEVVMEISV